VNFLIVGHTHSSIDQYFSVLSKAIRRAGFIGSPLSLEQVLKHAFINDKKGRKNPRVVRQIVVYYDMVTALKPFVNSKIKFYSIPHNFRIFIKCGIACTQYRMFSDHCWLPKQPENFISTTDITNHSIEEMTLPYFSLVGGDQLFFSEIGINKNDNLTLNNLHKIPLLVSINNVINALKDMEARTLIKLRKQFEELNYEDEKSVLVAVQKMMLECSAQEVKKNDTGGYIIWLKIQPNNENPLRNLNPLPCNNYGDLVINTEYIDALPLETYVEQVKQYLHSSTNDQLFENLHEIDDLTTNGNNEGPSNNLSETAVIEMMKALIAKKKTKKNRTIIGQQTLTGNQGIEIRQESEHHKRNSNIDPTQKCSKIVAAAQDIFQKLKSGKILLTNNNGNNFFILSYLLR
jgi:hypothetical protein